MRGLEKALYIRVYGDVQGVGFRGLVKRWAEELGVRGYVRNLPDGSVEIHAEGAPHAVDYLLQRIKSEAPVEIWDVEVREVEPKGFEGFFIVF